MRVGGEKERAKGGVEEGVGERKREEGIGGKRRKEGKVRG